MPNDELIDLAAKVCVPCQGGMDPLGVDQANSYLASLPGWELREKATRLYRSFRFDDFQSALDFVQQVGGIAEQERHHPDIELGWGYANILIFTHKIDGLHENDFILASKINSLLA
ncbi:MAG: 4a-hydroxytetrahydrobiopterin dehydratase [Rhodospirillaceae bacterium]|jgi:4a-hydroxytetrahydrobiopterin dehydratase|nr:4a-hydroxytetrahydrobiopterin dehydratase [Rhodospirillaceae bacterium]MBT4589652.1 4a-hydroxytetrahydrobiopterin dehydratase [Rhodospirillaceae bacterium]MBT4941118.1 4a-hydroxytetrahydrobiopterin dehydratase [Rhodospirillaceae bacterium]MBT5940734.1 4a-hydroxytetrahydrobiopterin dehydratase [Rhodospirillaceae bacterium]MBT7267041.1 4a-hydroxytetrahydrobiopterin dehydratase [Rhodospirillaceae bacterium]